MTDPKNRGYDRVEGDKPAPRDDNQSVPGFSENNRRAPQDAERALDDEMRRQAEAEARLRTRS